MSYNNNYQQGNQQQGGQQNSGPQSHVEIEIIAYLAEDPTSNQVGNELVGKSKIIVNHRNGDTDSWFLDVWTNNGGQSRGTYDFLMNYCPKGKKVFIKGTPMLQNKKQQDGSWKSFPTIRVSKLIAADSGPSAGGGQQGGAPQQGGYQAPQQGGYQAPQQQAPQQGYQPPAQGGYQAPAAPAQGGYQPPQGGGYQPPAQQGMPAQGGYPAAPPAGGYQPPAPGGAPAPQYGAPAGGPYQPPQQ